MSAAPLSNCAECQLLLLVPALKVNSNEGYLRWARLAKWHSHSARCQLPRKLPNWHLVQGIRPVMSKRYLISMCKQGSPSGLKNWSLTKVGEDTSQLYASLKLTHPFSKSPIYRALLWGLRRLEFCAKQGSAVGLQLELLGDCFYRGEEEISCCWGGAAGLEPFMVVTFSEPFSSINKALMFSYILVLQWCIVFICIFDSF
jgi:hypothetical protein